MPTGGLQAKTEFVEIFVMTPAESVALPTWYAEARSSTQQLGWGEDREGIAVRQMLGASILYAGIPRISGQLAVGFITSEKLAAGGKIEMGYPASMTIQCTGAFLHKIALVGIVTCDNFPKEGRLELNLAQPLPPGQQAFAVTSTCPFSSSPSDRFYIKVLDPTGQVVDARMNLPAAQIQLGLALGALELVWSSSDANRPATVSLGYELLQELPEKHLGPPVISEIIIEVPRDFAQQVRRINQIEVLANPFRWRLNDWMDSSDPRRLRLRVDDDWSIAMPTGRYRLSFPVMVPARMPKYNIFVITVCGPAGPNASVWCSGPDDPRAMASFPLAGFRLGDTHPSAPKAAVTGHAARALPTQLLTPLILAWMIVLPVTERAILRRAA